MQIKSRLIKASAPIRPPEAEGVTLRDTSAIARASEVVELDPATVDIDWNEVAHRKTQKYATIDVASTKGKVYRITVPSSYVPNIPKIWEWNERRLKAAELIAMGLPIAKVIEDPDVDVSARHIIYSWLQHPEFREHVDALIMETGFASRRERIAGLTRLTQKLFDRILDDPDKIPMTEKSIGALITGVMAGMKQIAQEKGEFVEQQSIEQTTTLNGTLATATIDVNALMKSKTDDERKMLEAEFEVMGDDIIRSITGVK